MKRWVAISCLAVAVTPATSPAGITFTRIADTTTTIPGGPGSFTSFGTVSVDGDNIAFVGKGSDWGGIYVFHGGAITKVADMATTMPDRGIPFSSFSGPVSISSGSIAFVAGGSMGGGVYTNLGGTLRAVASYAISPIPGGTGNFTGMDQPSISGENIAFNGYGSGDQAGVYIEKSGVLSQVVDTNTGIPMGTGKFMYISGTPGKLDGDSVAFRGSTSTQNGIYTSIDGLLARVADRNTAIPNSTGAFSDFDAPVMDGGAVAFHGAGAGVSGIYTDLGGSLQVVADTSTAIPEGAGNFGGFESYPSIDGGKIAFVGGVYGNTSPWQEGIYVRQDGTLAKIVDLGDSLDGKSLNRLGMFAESLDGDSLAFRAFFSDGSEGIYLATISEPAAIPEPSTFIIWSLLGTITTGIGWWRKRRAG